MEYELQSKPLDRLYLNKIFNNNDELIRGVKTILHFVCEITDIPRLPFYGIRVNLVGQTHTKVCPFYYK